jgi:hypothetical protein
MFSYGNSFYNTNYIIYVQGRLSDQFDSELNDTFLGWKNDQHLEVKYEDELDSVDLTKHLMFFGPIKSYKDLQKFCPKVLTFTDTGFRLGDNEFNDSLDAINIFSSDSTRYFQLGNSLSAVKSFWSTYTNMSQYFIMQSYSITHHGFLDGDVFNPAKHYDTKKLRDKQLKHYATAHYDFYYNKSIFSEKDNVDSLFNNENRKFDNVIEFFQLQKPERKISCYLYKDLEEKYYLSATPGYGNPFPLAWENHSVGFGPAEHETIHILFDNLVGRLSSFYAEGIVGYYYSTKDSLEWKRNKMIVSKEPGFTIKEYLNDESKFNFSELDYAASANFVKFLVDTYGLEKFKSFFASGEAEKGFSEVYGKTIDEISAGWEAYFQNNKVQLGPDREINIKVIADNLPDNSSIFITGNGEKLGRWNPGVVKLEKQADGSWTKTFSFSEGSILNYKITRGSWDKEALDANGNVPQNSFYEVRNDSTIIIEIKNWKDLIQH